MQQEWLRKRLDTFLPGLMRKHGVDMWVVPMREYNEDPVFDALTAPETFAARRRTIYVFFDTCARRPAGAIVPAAHRARRHVAGRRLRSPEIDAGGLREHRARSASGAVGRRAVAGAEGGHRGAQAKGHRHQPVDGVCILGRSLERRAERHERRARRDVDVALEGRRGAPGRTPRRQVARRRSVLPPDAGARVVADAGDVLVKDDHRRQDQNERSRLVVAPAGQRSRARHLVSAERGRPASRRHRGNAGRRSRDPGR